METDEWVPDELHQRLYERWAGTGDVIVCGEPLPEEPFAMATFMVRRYAIDRRTSSGEFPVDDVARVSREELAETIKWLAQGEGERQERGLTVVALLELHASLMQALHAAVRLSGLTMDQILREAGFIPGSELTGD